MILVDVNILVTAHNRLSPNHLPVKSWWTETLNHSPSVALPWITLLGFLRITTHRSIFQDPLPVSTAIMTIRDWLALPNVQVLGPGDGHAVIFLNLISELGTAGNLTTDAHLAALAIEYRAELASTDADFARFRGLRWFNPLEAR